MVIRKGKVMKSHKETSPLLAYPQETECEVRSGRLPLKDLGVPH